jgi:hypothetical protein
MATDHDSAFQALRDLLRTHVDGLQIATDTPECFCLEATPGPAALAAWRGKARRSTIPVAWVERGKSYVSYHLMGIDGNAPLLARISPELRARMQGKTCFNFQRADAALLAELDGVTADSIAGMRRAGFVTTE